MLVSYKWLSEYINLKEITAKELADKMSVTGIEVEGIVIPEEGLKKIVVGEVKECVPHSNSDHLSICQVDIGEEELSQIVCGAPNVKAGIKVIVALPGARIAGNQKIKKSKMRGEVSNGMICSLQELGYEESVIPKEYAEGIYYLPEEAVNGDSVFSYLEMDDAIIELSITPNRADALSMRGVAHEVAAIYRQKPTFKEISLTEDTSDKAQNYLSVTVEDEKDTPAYQMRIIKNVTIAESPNWLQNRLMNAGIRPINNVVDVTNYILLLFGQPLHAFDYKKLATKEIVVRRAKEKEQLITLDGETRVLTPENLVITNGHTPVALAGIMGGENTEISSETTTVALEAALFEGILVRKTSKQFHLRSEASSRFEKGINNETIGLACDAAAAMIAQLSGGTVVSEKVIGSDIEVKPVAISISLNRINQYIGMTLSEEVVSDIFKALDFPFTFKEGIYYLNIPPRRWDISIEATVISEVARIYGYDRIKATLPSGETVSGKRSTSQRLTRKLKGLMEGLGASEAISYALMTPEKATQFVMKESKVTCLQWPMSEERSALRQNLVSGLLDDVAYNVARKNTNVSLYEVGRVFYQENDPLKDLPYEESHLAFAITGNYLVKDWSTKAAPVDFYLAKGFVEEVVSALNLTKQITYIQTNEMKELHPGRSALIQLDGKTIGFVGQVHPNIAKNYGISTTYVAELNVKALVDYQADFMFEPISKFPEVSRDIALLVDETITHQALSQTIKKHAGNYLKSVHLFDVYQGATIEKDKKSMAYSLTFSNAQATLTDEEINHFMSKVEKALIAEYQVVIR